MDSRIATPEEHAAWKLELRMLLEQNGVSQCLVNDCVRLFTRALDVDPNKPVGWSQILDVLLSFEEVVSEAGYGTAWNNQSGEIESFEGKTKVDIALAYMNKIHNQRPKPYVLEVEDLLSDANVPEDVFEKACEILNRIQYRYYFDEGSSFANSATHSAPKPETNGVFSDVNDWFLSLEPGRQKALIDDKWMLAGAAYRAGLAASTSSVVLQPTEGSKLRCTHRLATGALVFEEGREYEVKRLQGGIIDIYNDSVGSYATLALDKLGLHFEVSHYASSNHESEKQVVRLHLPAPQGWKLVPETMTPEMQRAAKGISRWQYDDLLEAAPAAPLVVTEHLDQDEREAFELRIEAEAGPSAKELWFKGNPEAGYKNTRTNDYRFGWIMCLEWMATRPPHAESRVTKALRRLVGEIDRVVIDEQTHMDALREARAAILNQGV